MTGRLDAFGRRHPACMVLAVVLLACLVTVLLLYHENAPAVVYQGF